MQTATIAKRRGSPNQFLDPGTSGVPLNEEVGFTILGACDHSLVPHACLTANTREQASYKTTMSVVKTVKGRKALLTALEQVGTWRGVREKGNSPFFHVKLSILECTANRIHSRTNCA